MIKNPNIEKNRAIVPLAALSIRSNKIQSTINILEMAHLEDFQSMLRFVFLEYFYQGCKLRFQFLKASILINIY